MTRARFRPALALAALALATLVPATLVPIGAGPAMAADVQAGALIIYAPHAFETPPLAPTGAAYFTVENTGDSADTLLAVEAPPYRAELHRSVEEDGMHKMLAVESLPIPAHGAVELAPGDYHVMLLDAAEHPLVAGTELPGVLVFERAGRVEVTFAVEKRGAGAGMEMDHDHAMPGHDGHAGH